MKVFTKNDSGFICEACGRKVEPLGYSSRNHCPYCLCSLHIDINPGDRMNECKGVMYPYRIIDKKGEKAILHKCTKCGEEKVNKIAEDDDIKVIVAVSNYTYDNAIKKNLNIK